MINAGRRRPDVVGRVCCIVCRRMVANEDGLAMHRRLMFQGGDPHHVMFDREGWRRAQLRRSYKVRHGVVMCHAHRPKVIFESHDAALLGAMLKFIERGAIVDPYQCSDLYISKGRNVTPVWRYGCGRWHLSRSVFRLPP